MNLVTLPITADGVKIGDSTLELERDQLTKLSDAGLSEVTFGIRPEQLELTDSGGVEVVVDLVEDLGSEAYVYTHAGSGVELVARCNPRTGPQAGRHGAVAQASRRRGSPVPPGDRRTHQLIARTRGAIWHACTGVAAPGTDSRTPRLAVGPTASGVERPRRSTARHRGGTQPPPGEVRRRRRRAVGGQGHAARIAAKEYDVLRRLEEMGLPAVRPAGLVLQPEFDTAILVTRYLEGSWQYRRLFMRLPPDQPKHRARLLDAMAGLLVELHRHGVFWGDCSLANTLFSRDGQLLQAWLVDAETSEVHPSLSRGQRRHDLEIMVENVAEGMVDLAERLGRPEELHDTLIAEAEQVRAPLRHAVGRAARRTRLRLHRPLPRRGDRPPPQRARLRGRRSIPAAGQRRSEPTQNPCRRW